MNEVPLQGRKRNASEYLMIATSIFSSQSSSFHIYSEPSSTSTTTQHWLVGLKRLLTTSNGQTNGRKGQVLQSEELRLSPQQARSSAFFPVKATVLKAKAIVGPVLHFPYCANQSQVTPTVGFCTAPQSIWEMRPASMLDPSRCHSD